MSDPDVVSRDEWLAARMKLLAKEKELTRQRDALSAERRRLPMVELDKEYVFEGADGKRTLLELFDGRRQLITYHFMWLFDEGRGCPSCTFLTSNMPPVEQLHARDTSLVVVSRGEWADIDAYRARLGFTMPWFSSFGSDFNYDFHVTIDEKVAPVEYNYKDIEQLERENVAWRDWSGEQPGVSAFLRQGDRVFHTYSAYSRGFDILLNTHNYLDLTALGRQEDWEEPTGRSNTGSPLLVDFYSALP